MSQYTSLRSTTPPAPVIIGDVVDEAEIITRSPIKLTYLIITTFGLVGNLLNLMVFLGSSKFRNKKTNVILIGQSLIDGSVSLVTMVMMSINIDTSGMLYCVIFQADIFYWSLLLTSTWQSVWFAVARCLSCCCPQFYARVTSGRVLAFGVVICLACFGLELAFLLPTTKIIEGQCIDWDIFPSDKARSIYGLCIFSVEYLIPLSIIIFLCTKIYIKIKPNVNRIRPEISKWAISDSQKNDYNINKTLVAMIIVMLVCNSPRSVLYMTSNIGLGNSLSGVSYQIASAMNISKIALNPFVYIVFYKAFRNEFISSLFKIFNWIKLICKSTYCFIKYLKNSLYLNLRKLGNYPRKCLGFFRGTRDSYPLETIAGIGKCDVVPQETIRTINETIECSTIVQFDIKLNNNGDLSEVIVENDENKKNEDCINHQTDQICDTSISNTIDVCQENIIVEKNEHEIKDSCENNVKDTIHLFEDINTKESILIKKEQADSKHINAAISEDNHIKSIERTSTLENSFEVQLKDSLGSTENGECKSILNIPIAEHIDNQAINAGINKTSTNLKDSRNWIPTEMDNSLQEENSRRISLSKNNISKSKLKKTPKTKEKVATGKIKIVKKNKSKSEKKNKKCTSKKDIKSTKSN